jgi:hypothetical protein
MRPLPSEYSGYNSKYIALTTTDDLQLLLKESTIEMQQYLNQLPASKAYYAYAAGKWTLKEVLQHCIDTERIFAYRALCIARSEQQNLPGFEENDYAANSFANARTWDGLIEELILVRKTTILMFQNFNNEQLQMSGITSGKAVTTNALGFLIVGHFMHHINIVNERYIN